MSKLYILTHGTGGEYRQYPVLINPAEIPAGDGETWDRFYVQLAETLKIEDFDIADSDCALTGPIDVGDIPVFGKAVRELKLIVPTYNEKMYPTEVAAKTKPEWGEPLVPLLVRESDGVRIVLGSHDIDSYYAPDVQIERQPHGWVIFLHSSGGADPCGYVYFLDDGRSYFHHGDYGPTPATTILDKDDPIPPEFAKPGT